MDFRLRIGRAAILFAALTASCGGGEADTVGALSERLLLITVDTLRADHVGVYGGPVPTPAIDRLAHEGVQLRGFCTPLPSTGPAHLSLFTGLHPWNHGVHANAAVIEDETLPNAVVRAQEAGLSTAAFVSSYVLHERWGFGRGFDSYHFEPTNEHNWKGEQVGFWSRGEDTTAAALRWLEAHRSEPFLVWVHYFDPHLPYNPPPEFRRPIDEPVSLAGKPVPSEAIGVKLKRKIRGYRGEVTYTDNEVAKLIDGLRQLELYDRTAIVLTSDHGEGLGDHGLFAHGENLFDELVTIPLIVRAPGLSGGRSLDGPAQLEDLMPTMLAMLGLPVPTGIDGMNLLPWIRGTVAASPRAAVLGQRSFYGADSTIFFERAWPNKWIGYLDGEGTQYALDADPRESGGTPGDASARLRAATEGKRGRPAQRELDEEAQRAMQALGYGGS